MSDYCCWDYPNCECHIEKYLEDLKKCPGCGDPSCPRTCDEYKDYLKEVNEVPY